MSYFVIKNDYITMSLPLKKSIEVSERGKNNEGCTNLVNFTSFNFYNSLSWMTMHTLFIHFIFHTKIKRMGWHVALMGHKILH